MPAIEITTCRKKTWQYTFCNGAAAPLVLLLLAGGAAMPSDRYPVDWNQVHRETLEYDTNVLRLDNANLPGNRSKIAVTSRTFLIAKALPQLLLRDSERARSPV